MRDKYWAMFTAIKHYEQYYEHYQIRAKRFNALISGACMLFSVGGIAGWSIWQTLPWLWAIIIATMQIISILNPLFPFSKQIIATKFLIPEITKLLNEIAFDWNKIDQLSDTKITNLIHKYSGDFNELENRFTNDSYFPYNHWSDKQAEIECKKYFSHYYNV